MQVYFPSVCLLFCLLTPSILCACFTTHARSFFHRPLIHILFPFWHQQVLPDFSALSFKSFPNTDLSKAFRLYPLKKGIHHATHSVTLTEHHPSSWQWHSGEHPPPLLGGCLSLCPPSTCTAHAGKGLHELCHLGAFWKPGILSPWAAHQPASCCCCWHRAMLPGTAKQQCCSGMTAVKLFQGSKKTLLLWGLVGRTVLSLWPHSVTFSGSISSSRWETLPNTHKTEAALSPLGTTPSLLHAKGTVWNKKANEPSCSRQCHRWGCSHKAKLN